ncbi:MAG: photosystem II stability/assembly factor-like uncharacterized protein [Motiliproteus sp.]|jgi:photosystem II stability/assembly factor-like uncharacterized protein
MANYDLPYRCSAFVCRHSRPQQRHLDSVLPTAVLMTVLMALLILPTLSFAALPDRASRPSAPVDAGQRFPLMDITPMADRLLSVGERGRILISFDQGGHWRQAQVPVSVLLTAVDAATDTSAWAVGHDSILLNSTDQGESWTLALDGPQINQLVADYYQQLLARAVADPESTEDLLDELQFRAEDAQFAIEDKLLRTLLDVAFIDADHGYVLGAYGLLLATQDGGKSWQPMMEELGNPNGFHLNAITYTDNGVLIAGEAGVLFRRLNGDNRWEALASPYEGSFFGAQSLGDDRLLVYGLRGHAFISADGGDSWEQLDLPLKRTLTGAAQLEDGTLVLVGSFGAVLVKSPGQPFRMQRLAIPAPSMAVVPLTADRILVVGLAGAQPLALSPVLSAPTSASTTVPTSSAKQGN